MMLLPDYVEELFPLVICITPGVKVHYFCLFSSSMEHLQGISIIVGMSETVAEMAKSILAQLEFTFQIKEWERKGVAFQSHLYVPEHHPVTGYLFCEREDEGHVFKVRVVEVLSVFALNVPVSIGVELIIRYSVYCSNPIVDQLGHLHDWSFNFVENC